MRISAVKDAAAFLIEIDRQNTVIVIVPPGVYAAITSTGTVLSADSLLGKTVHATGKTEPYTGRNEAWKKRQQLTIEMPTRCELNRNAFGVVIVFCEPMALATGLVAVGDIT